MKTAKTLKNNILFMTFVIIISIIVFFIYQKTLCNKIIIDIYNYYIDIEKDIDSVLDSMEDDEMIVSDNYNIFVSRMQARKRSYNFLIYEGDEKIFSTIIDSDLTNFNKRMINKAIDEDTYEPFFSRNGMILQIPNDDETLSIYLIELGSNPYTSKTNNDYIFGVSLFIFYTLLSCLYYIYRRKNIFLPIEKLITATEAIRKGNYDYVIDGKLLKNSSRLKGVFYNLNVLKRELSRGEKERILLRQDREEYIAGVTHDLNTPLTVIIGFAKGLIDGVANTKDKRERYLTNIYDTALQMSELVSKIKEMSFIDTQKIEYDFKLTNIVAFFDELLEKKADTYRHLGLEVTSRVTTQLGTQASSTNDYMVNIDHEEFSRVVSNILSNSIKYKKGKLAISEIKISRGYNRVIISFKDAGLGVAESELNKIFDSFYRADSSRTKPTEGSGLGLYVVKSIVTAHNGTVRALSHNGLEIIIDLPEVK